ncbi:MAG TPA: TMEM165/GDT1 family protein [Candidatus Bathyarchaeia archaeon]
MDLLPVLSTFLLILVAELGDKTQLAVISLSCRYKGSHVFAGAMLAFLAVDGVSLLVGGPLLALLPVRVVLIVTGIIFILFGIIPLLRKETDVKLKKRSSVPMFASFSLVAMMELGDKTQLASIALAAETSPVLVLLGIVMAFALLTGVGVVLGAKLVSRLPMKWLRIGTSTLFIIIGAFSILNATWA